MSDIDKRIVRQMRWLSIAVAVLILLIGVNFYIALARPNESTQTILGPVGPQGALGLQGERGDKGDKGDTGSSGLPGTSGGNGANGMNGIDGRDGLPGRDGTDGAAGANGTNGRTPEMACVDGNVSWKYTDEVTWRPLYPAVCPMTSEYVME